MRFRKLHDWNLSYHEAVAWQRKLRCRLRTDVPLDLSRVRLVAGADVAYEPRRRHRGRSGHGGEPTARFAAAVVVMTFPDLAPVETAAASAETSFPYIPGLLSFREGPALQEAFARLASRPDAVIFDSQGIAHPRGLGLAAHLGLLLRCPTVGCAKSRLFGRTRGEPGVRRGNRRAVLAPDPAASRRGPGVAGPPAFRPGERIGTLLRTRDGVKPVWVSCGHLVNLPSAERLVLRCARGFRLPEPVRSAHQTVNDMLGRLAQE